MDNPNLRAGHERTRGHLLRIFVHNCARFSPTLIRDLNPNKHSWPQLFAMLMLFGVAVAIAQVIGAAFDSTDVLASNNGVSVHDITFPDAPINVTAISGNTQVTVSWSAPASDGGAAITHYTVTSNPGDLTATTTATSTSVTGLSNGTTYTFTVTAMNSVGASLNSQPSNAVTPVFPGVSVTGTIEIQGVSSTTIFSTIGITVTLTPTGGGASTSIVVAADGSFELTGVVPGSYTVIASAPGYLSSERQNFVVVGTPVVMLLVALRGGDANGDGVVSIRDISTIAASFGTNPVARVDGSGRIVDINGDGIVDILDISNAASNFGAVGPLSWQSIR